MIHFQVLMHTLGIYEVFPYSPYMTWIDNNICAKSQFQFICRDILYFIGGFDDKELNRVRNYSQVNFNYLK